MREFAMIDSPVSGLTGKKGASKARDRHVAALLAMTVSSRAGRPPAGVELAMIDLRVIEPSDA
jgi:hypothetical protein